MSKTRRETPCGLITDQLGKLPIGGSVLHNDSAWHIVTHNKRAGYSVLEDSLGMTRNVGCNQRVIVL